MLEGRFFSKGRRMVIFVGEIRKKRRRRRERRRIYDKEVLEGLKKIWRYTNFLCDMLGEEGLIINTLSR